MTKLKSIIKNQKRMYGASVDSLAWSVCGLKEV